MTIVNVQNEVDCVYRIGRVENIVHVGYLSSVFSWDGDSYNESQRFDYMKGRNIVNIEDLDQREVATFCEVCLSNYSEVVELVSDRQRHKVVPTDDFLDKRDGV